VNATGLQGATRAYTNTSTGTWSAPSAGSGPVSIRRSGDCHASSRSEPAGFVRQHRAVSAAEWRRARVGLDYHVEVKDFFYSVPHTLIRAEVDIRVTARTVEIFHRGRRIAAHQRRYGGRRHGTDPDHMPSSQKKGLRLPPRL
jgi:hypothetical protein